MKRRRSNSKGETAVAKFLTQHHIQFIQEKSFDNCRAKRVLRFDFFLPDLNLLIEYQGQHHYAPINKYRRAKRTHEMTKAHDKIKRQFVSENNFNFLEIHYKDFKKINEILLDIIKTL